MLERKDLSTNVETSAVSIISEREKKPPEMSSSYRLLCMLDTKHNLPKNRRVVDPLLAVWISIWILEKTLNPERDQSGQGSNCRNQMKKWNEKVVTLDIRNAFNSANWNCIMMRNLERFKKIRYYRRC